MDCEIGEVRTAKMVRDQEDHAEGEIRTMKVKRIRVVKWRSEGHESGEGSPDFTGFRLNGRRVGTARRSFPCSCC